MVKEQHPFASVSRAMGSLDAGTVEGIARTRPVVGLDIPESVFTSLSEISVTIGD